MLVSTFTPFCYSDMNVNTDLWYNWIFEIVDKKPLVELGNGKVFHPGFPRKPRM